jgi:hypothetical protein
MVLGPSPIARARSARPISTEEEQEMLAVSTPAKEMLRDVELPEDRVLRLEPQNDGGLTFVAGPAEADDQVVEDGGREVLHIAGLVSRQLDGQMLDRIETAEGPRLTIRSPEADTQP